VKSVAFSSFYIKQLIKHYGSATLIDVLHSPFVFKLYNDCIKKNSNISLLEFIPQSSGYINKRIETILAKSIAQFPHSIHTDCIKEITPGVPFILNVTENSSLKELNDVLLTAHNDSVCILRNMYHSPESAEYWNKVKKLESVTASVDLLFVGFVFVRKEQRKQEFRLRLF
jgi:hypothetical protein